MEDEFFNRSENSSRKDSLFGWTIAILLLIGITLASWIGSFYIFGHPEIPFCYNILQKVGKIDQPKRFELTSAPKGEFLTPKSLYERYSGLPDFEIATVNQELLRNFINNYPNKKEKVPYVIGNFNIMEVYDLSEEDIFEPGVVAIAQSNDFPAVLLEHIYTAPPEAIPILKQMLRSGLDITIKRSWDLCALLHIDKLPDGRMKFTVVPLLYGTYNLNDGATAFRLQPPAQVNVAASWPLVSLDQFTQSEAEYQAYRQREGLAPQGTTEDTASTIPVLSTSADIPKIAPVATTTPIPVPEFTPTPPPVSTPPAAQTADAIVVVPTATPEESLDAPRALPVDDSETLASTNVPRALPVLPPPPVQRENGTLIAAVTPAPAPTPVPAPTLPPNVPLAGEPQPPVSAGNPTPAPPRAVPLKPFISSAGTSTAPPAQPAAAWQTYQPGRMPLGRLVNVEQAASFASTGKPAERMYLQGNFEVSASRGRQAILRSRSGLLGGNRNTRIIVEYPSESLAPTQGANVSRGSQRPFEITAIRQSPEGINIFVREITSPE